MMMALSIDKYKSYKKKTIWQHLVFTVQMKEGLKQMALVDHSIYMYV